MATGDTGTRVYGDVPGREDILPALFLGGLGVFASQRMGEAGLAMPLSQVLLMQRLDPGQVVLEQRCNVAGKVVNRSLSPLPAQISQSGRFHPGGWPSYRDGPLSSCIIGK
jgi:hypothetical protein